MLGFCASIQNPGIQESSRGKKTALGCLVVPSLSSSEEALTAREGLSVPVAVMERKLMKYGP